MLLREAVLETFLELFTTSGETGTHSPGLGPRGTAPCPLLLGALPLRDRLPCHLRRSWTPAKCVLSGQGPRSGSGGALPGGGSACEGHICE